MKQGCQKRYTNGTDLPNQGRLTEQYYRIALLLIFCLGLVLRWYYGRITGGAGVESFSEYVNWSMENYFGGISVGYFHFADQIVEGRPYLTSAYPPGYPAFLAVFKWLGYSNPFFARVAQFGIDSAGVVLIAALVLRIFSSQMAALLAALIYAILPIWVFGSSILLAEAFSPVLFLGIVLTLWIFYDTRHFLYGILAGGLTGFAAIFRPDLILLIAPVLLWIFVHSRVGKGTRNTIAALVAFAVFILPWGIHNYQTHGRFNLTSNAGGYALWSGLGVLPNKYGYYVSDDRAIKRLNKLGIVWDSYERGDFFMKEYLAAWRDHPGHVIKTIFHRLKTMPLSQKYVFYPNYLKTLNKKFAMLSLVALAILSLLLLRQKRYWALSIVLLPLFYAMGTLGLIYYEPRYVRYISLTYVLAWAGLLAFAIDYLSRKISCTASHIFGSGVLGLGLIYASTGIVTLVQGAEQARLKAAIENKLVSRIIADDIHLAINSPRRWQKAVPGVEYHYKGSNLFVTTNDSLANYQLVSEIPAKAGEHLVIEYEIKLIEGGMAIGILTRDGSRFIQTAVFRQPGVHKGRLIAAALQQSGPKLVLMNSRQQKGISRFLLQDLRLGKLKLD